MLENIPAYPKILDIGCGKGVQTLELARISNGHATGLDNHKPFLDELTKNAKEAGLSEKIESQLGSMFKLTFPDECFDVIWSEGAIYIIGFERGLRDWRRLIKVGGYIVASELSWLKPNPPEIITEYWKREYPGIKSMTENSAVIKDTGYKLIGQFRIPAAIWWTSLYDPMKEGIQALEQKYENNAKAQTLFKVCKEEMDIFHKYSEWYGYVFYVIQKTGQ